MEAIFVRTLDGVFKVATTTSGAWNIVSQELRGMEVNVLAAHPRRRGIVYAGIRGGGLYRTDDAGKNWRRLGADILPEKIRALAPDPSNPETIYVGTEPPALWRSEDGGGTWKEIPGVGALAYSRRWTFRSSNPISAVSRSILSSQRIFA
jgi:photosystem II stability/assembly factor-like uncharacterized protein